MQLQHSAGGKVNSPIVKDTQGSALYYGEKAIYRPILTRIWNKNKPINALLIGMNPSTAGAITNDSTITKEIGFLTRLNYGGFIKCNVMDYRLTDSSQLSKIDRPCSPDNHRIILKEAQKASLVICCWGNPVESLTTHYNNLINLLRANNICLMCFGHNKNGSPKHTVRLPYSTQLEEWKAYG